MKETRLQSEMKQQTTTKELLEQAKGYAYDFLDGLPEMEVYPSEQAIARLSEFEEAMPKDSGSPTQILSMLQKYGSGALTAQGGGKYFGFVVGGSLPITLASRWMADTWDQNSGLYVLSPLVAKLEDLCEKWLVELLGLPEQTAAGFISGSSTAILCALAAARNELLRRNDWDVNSKGLFGAPPIKVVLGDQAHSSVFKALAILGLGKDRVMLAKTDDQGCIIPELLPALDRNTLLIIQAGNVNSGAFDPIEKLCDMAIQAEAWVHVDGAFGLWAAASEKRNYLTKGMEKADSWSTDAHKTLNVPYDSGIVFCKNRSALVNAMQATGSYIQYSEHRDGMLYTPEMSRREKSVELWAALKYLGKTGVGELVDTLCENAEYFAKKLLEQGFHIPNDIVYNQILVQCDSAQETKDTLTYIQASRKCWCGGATWKKEPIIRVSVCSWQTTKKDIDECVKVFVASREKAGR